jgi:hypothetical protein
MAVLVLARTDRRRPISFRLVAMWLGLLSAGLLPESVTFQGWVDAGRPRAGRLPGALSRAEGWKQRSPTWRLFVALRSQAPWPLRGTFRDRDGREHEMWFPEFPGPAQSPVDHPGWPVLAEALRKGAELLRREQVALVVLLVPMKVRGLGPSVTLEPRLLARVGSNWDLPSSWTLAAYLQKLCAELDVSFVDATPALREAAAAGELVYLPRDTHLSLRGHGVVSATLVEAIRTPSK